MRVPFGRRSAVPLALAVALLVTMLGSSTAAARYEPRGLKAFMYAVGQVESGGRYTARNASSGAYGKYQIMPANWPSWAKRYLGNSKAKPTPANQEKVAAGKFRDLHHKLGTWHRVAYWWLTGSSNKTGWSAYATRYVRKVIHLYRLARDGKAGTTSKAGGSSVAAVKRYAERNAAIDYTGRWRTASHNGYAGDGVRYATKAGAKATLVFTGRRITWYGPTGPTRGKARVFVDGDHVRTVDLHARSFDAREAVFRKTWSKPGKHRITIIVAGTKRHPMVAIDELVVVP